jgi:cell division protein FtsZ
MFEIVDEKRDGAVIKVIGVGGCGGNAVEHMINKGVAGVEFIAANTDSQVLDRNPASQRIALGNELTQGLGAGAKPEVGRDAAMESKSSSSLRAWAAEPERAQRQSSRSSRKKWAFSSSRL